MTSAEDRYRILLDASSSLADQPTVKAVLHSLRDVLSSTSRLHGIELYVLDDDENSLRVLEFDRDADAPTFKIGTRVSRIGAAARVLEEQKPVFVPDSSQEMLKHPALAPFAAETVGRTAYLFPVSTAQKRYGFLSVTKLQGEEFAPEDVELLRSLASHVAVALECALARDRADALAVDNALAFQEIAELKDKLAEEKFYLEDEIRTEHNFEEMVGESPALKLVLQQVETVARTDSTVLILGETGTGKELIARAIHHLSTRRARSLVKLNCAAIPTGLLESELFGHEKGAFTGAIAQKIGRVELADKGTLFLDEVGDIPLELQPKLLRVLQEQEFERLGGIRTIQVDARLVVATNRDLGQMVAQRQFRQDLFYRLNIFPIRMPPLRERAADIPLLVNFFVKKYAKRMGKRIDRVPTETMRALARWHWPGNVRELENVIERALILSQGPVLNVSLAELRGSMPTPPMTKVQTLEASEKEIILRALRESNGIIASAAGKLGMKRTTLNSKMRKLHVRRSDLFSA